MQVPDSIVVPLTVVTVRADTTFVQVQIDVDVHTDSLAVVGARIQAALDQALARDCECLDGTPWWAEYDTWWKSATVTLLSLAVYRMWNPKEHPVAEHSHELPEHEHDHPDHNHGHTKGHHDPPG
jgi:hypothetical protein